VPVAGGGIIAHGRVEGGQTILGLSATVRRAAVAAAAEAVGTVAALAISQFVARYPIDKVCHAFVVVTVGPGQAVFVTAAGVGAHGLTLLLAADTGDIAINAADLARARSYARGIVSHGFTCANEVKTNTFYRGALAYQWHVAKRRFVQEVTILVAITANLVASFFVDETVAVIVLAVAQVNRWHSSIARRRLAGNRALGLPFAGSKLVGSLACGSHAQFHGKVVTFT